MTEAQPSRKGKSAMLFPSPLSASLAFTGPVDGVLELQTQPCLATLRRLEPAEMGTLPFPLHPGALHGPQAAKP